MTGSLLWRSAVALMYTGIIAFVGFVIWRAVVPAEWEFSIETETEVAELGLKEGARTQWQVDGVVLCTRGKVALGDQFRLDQAASPCGSRAWQAWQVSEPEQVLELEGNVATSLSIRPEGGLAVSVRSPGDSSVGTFSAIGIVEDVALGKAVNLIWPTIPAKPLTFPFSGTTTLGRTVGWANNGMLRSGSVSIYTSDESADKRSLVDSTSLMLGDQIRLGDTDTQGSWPKGFARIAAEDTFIRIVAFGRADSLRIERFGESGYDLKPSNLRKLASDPSVAFYGALLAAYMSAIFGFKSFVDTGRGSGQHTFLARFRRLFDRNRRQ